MTPTKRQQEVLDRYEYLMEDYVKMVGFDPKTRNLLIRIGTKERAITPQGKVINLTLARS